MQQKKIAAIISKVKKVRDDNGLTCQAIHDLVQKNGIDVSLSTIKRIFEDGSETYGFQYESTLKPVVDAVLGIYGDSKAATEDEADAMKAVIDFKSDRITELEAQLQRCEESYKRRIEFLKKQISLKDERIDRRDAMIEKLLDALPICRQKGCDSCVCPARAETGTDIDIPSQEPD